MTPSTCALLVVFCRNHNVSSSYALQHSWCVTLSRQYVAARTYTENGNCTYVDPATLDDEKRAVQDAELFHRARLVSSAFYAQIVLGDYVGSILGLTRDGFSWRLDLPQVSALHVVWTTHLSSTSVTCMCITSTVRPQSMRDLSHSWTPRGEGNVVSAEFNLMYRWHPAISQEDTTWMEHFFHGLFHGKPASQVCGTMICLI